MERYFFWSEGLRKKPAILAEGGGNNHNYVERWPPPWLLISLQNINYSNK